MVTQEDMDNYQDIMGETESEVNEEFKKKSSKIFDRFFNQSFKTRLLMDEFTQGAMLILYGVISMTITVIIANKMGMVAYEGEGLNLVYNMVTSILLASMPQTMLGFVSNVAWVNVRRDFKEGYDTIAYLLVLMFTPISASILVKGIDGIVINMLVVNEIIVFLLVIAVNILIVWVYIKLLEGERVRLKGQALEIIEEYEELCRLYGERIDNHRVPFDIYIRSVYGD